MMKKQYAVIGLGRFGSGICERLIKEGQEVLAIDKDEKIISDFTDIATHAITANAADEGVVKSIGLRNFDHVVVAIGDDIQASTLTTLILKEIGVKKVTAKALNENHGKVLERIGADKVVHPEKDSGERIAMSIISSNVLDYVELSDAYSIVEVIVSDKLHQKTLTELDIRAKYGITILVIKSEGKLNVSPAAQQRLYKGDTLVIMGDKRNVEKFQSKMLDHDDN